MGVRSLYGATKSPVRLAKTPRERRWAPIQWYNSTSMRQTPFDRRRGGGTADGGQCRRQQIRRGKLAPTGRDQSAGQQSQPILFRCQAGSHHRRRGEGEVVQVATPAAAVAGRNGAVALCNGDRLHTEEIRGRWSGGRPRLRAGDLYAGSGVSPADALPFPAGRCYATSLDGTSGASRGRLALPQAEC